MNALSPSTLPPVITAEIAGSDEPLTDVMRPIAETYIPWILGSTKLIPAAKVIGVNERTLRNWNDDPMIDFSLTRCGGSWLVAHIEIAKLIFPDLANEIFSQAKALTMEGVSSAIKEAA